MRLRHPHALALALTCGATVLPASASAAVRIGASGVAVSGAAGSVVVTRAPFGLTVRDTAGRRVLASAPAAGDLLVEPPVPRTLFGRQDPPRPALYAPLSFTVGTHRIEQTPGGQWEGTLLSTTEGGIEYRATRVLSARRAGNGAELVLATSDPTGRRIVLYAGASTHRTLRISARPSPATGVATMATAWSSGPGEAFRGFGGRHDYLDQHGRDLLSFTSQENVSSGSASGLTATTDPSGDRYMFPNGSSAAYYVQALFASSRRYGFLLDRPELADFRVASDRADAWRVGVAAPAFDARVTTGSSRRVIQALSGTNGRPPVPPRWALGHELDRLVQFPSDPPDHYAAMVRADLRDMRRYRIPVSSYRIEGWQFLPRATLRGFIRTLRARGIHPLLYFRLFVGKDEIGTDSPAAYDEALAKGYVATKPGGGPYVFVSNFNREGAQIDFTNPAAVRWWKGRITAALRLGADGFMQDFGEQTLPDMRFHDGTTGAQSHNRIPVLAHRATAQAVTAFERTHPKRHIWWFTRSGYSGTPGSSRYEPANFPGDETTDWTRSSGLASQTPDMLNRSLGGAWGFATDIGGFFDVGPYGATSAELFTRWAQWAALSPFFRLHGSVAAGTHMPWSYGKAVLARYRAALRLHLRARPLIARLWRAGRRSGIGPVRPLWLADPASRRAAAQDQEWLLGPDVLVAPVVAEGARSRVVFFPRGCWKPPGRFRAHHGPASARVPAPLGRLPYYVRCGTKPF